MKNKKLFFLAAVIFIFGLLADAGPALANCATGENDPGCYGSVSLGQSCGTGKTCQQESCGESWVYSCLTTSGGGTTTNTTSTTSSSSTGCRNAGDSCTTTTNKPGVCGSISSTSSGGGSTTSSTGFICWPASGSEAAASGSGVLANNCSGTCRTSCESAGETRSSNVSEYCGTDGYECCVTVNTCTNTAGNSCKSDMCSTLDGMQSSSGTCPTGEYCCRATASTDSCTSTRGNSCRGDMCATLDGYESASGTCPSGEYCCKEKSAAAASSGGSYSIEWEKETPSSGTAWNVQSVGGFGLPSGKVSGIIESLVAWLLGIFGFLGIITFVIAGIYYFTAAGDAEMEKKAKNAMKMGIIGIVVGLVGLVIIQAVDLLLNAGTSF